jgi:hypothetical protein
MIAALLLACQQPPTVTIDQPCAHSSVVLAAFGKAIGETVRPSGSVQGDYIALKLTDRPVAEAKRVIAEALNAEWVVRGGVLYLDRNAKHHNAEKKAEDEALRAALQKHLDDNKDKKFERDKLREVMIEALRARDVNDFIARRYGEFSTLMPERTLGPQLVMAFGIDRLVKMANGERLTYAQQDLPQAAKIALDQSARDANDAWELAQSLGVDAFTNYGFVRQTAPNTVVKVELRRSDGMLSVHLHESATLPGGGSMTSSKGLVYVSGRGAPKGERPSFKTNKPFVWEGLAARVVPVVSLAASPNQPGIAGPTKEDVAFVRSLAGDLSTNELLAVYGDAPLRQLAAAEGFDYVALVPDSVAAAPWIMGASGSSVQSVFSRWGLAVTQDKDTKIVVALPMDTVRARESRFDRRAVSQFVSSFHTAGRATLESLASLAAASDGTREYSANLSVARLFVPWREWRQSDWRPLALYGALNTSQKRAAANGGVLLEWRHVSPAVRSEIEKTLGEQQAMYVDELPSEVFWGSPWMGGAFPGAPRFMALDRVPSGAQVRVRRLTNTMLKANSTDQFESRPMTVEEAASYARSQSDERAPNYRQLRVASLDRIQVDLFLPGVGYTSFAAQVDDTTEDSEYVAWDKLPEPWKSQLADAAKKYGGG